MDSAGKTSGDLHHDPALRDKARTAWTLGLAAIILAMLACGSSYVTLLPALPLGLLASSNARAVLGHPDLDAVSEVYARTGQITGLAAALWAGLGILLILAVVVLYAGMFAFVIGAANL
jgi:hypothetical protein